MKIDTRFLSTLASCLFLTLFSISAGQPFHGLPGIHNSRPLLQILTPPQGEATAAASPDMSISLSHTSSFLRGQTNAVYLIRITNNGGSPTSGVISVIESLPAGLHLTSMSGPGWSCLSNTCNRYDSLQPGHMLPAITVQVTVDSNAPASISNFVTVSGGGDWNIADNLATDITNIAAEGWLYGFTSGGVTNSPISYIPAGVSDVVAVAVAESETLALRKNGTVVQWDGFGRGTPAVAQALTGVIAIATDELHSYALKSNGTVVAWGRLSAPPDTSGLTNIVSIAANGSSALAVRADGYVSTITQGTTAFLTIPSGLTNTAQLSIGPNIVLALDTMGHVTSWGGFPAVPVPTEKLTQVLAVANGTGAGIRTDGTVLVWQTSPGGDLGTIPSGVNGITALAGSSYLVALKADGTARGWGTQPFFSPAQANGLAQTTAIAGSYSYALAILSAPTVTLSFQGTAQAVDLADANTVIRPAIAVDGATATIPFFLRVAPGSTHTISAAAAQPGGNAAVQYYFNSWSDGGAATHIINAGTVDTFYTANFKTKFLLTTSAGAGGTISPASALYDAGSAVLAKATPSIGYLFSGFNTDAQGTDGNNPIRVLMNAPHSLTANFVAQAQGSLRLTLKPLHTLLSGQQNAAYVARVINDGPSAQNGVQVVFSGATPSSLTGTGWTCSGASCSRPDALPPGQAYPAILMVTPLPEFAGNKVTISAATNPTCASCEARATAPVYSAANSAVAWGGNNQSGQLTVPGGLTKIVDVSAGSKHSVALLGDGKVAAWGDNTMSQTQAAGSLAGVVSVAAGSNHTLALIADGHVTAWGDNSSGQATVPDTLPAVIAVAAGAQHSLALTSAGNVVAWGDNSSGQTSIPGSVQDAIAIAAGGDHSLAVLRNGTVIAWGSNTNGESSVPGTLQGAAAVTAGAHYSAAILDDGSAVVWGNNPASIVSGLPAGLADVRVLSAGGAHALALKWDGAVLAWGANPAGQTTLPAGLSSVTAIAAGAEHSLAVSSGPPTIAVPFSTLPAGGSYSVDGVSYTGAQNLLLAYGQPHVVTVSPLPAQPSPGTQLTFLSWGDGYKGTTRTITPMQSTGYTLTFNARYKLTAAASPSNYGTIRMTPSSADGWYDGNQSVQFTGTPGAGYMFTTFSGDLSGTNNPQSLTMAGPRSVTANFAVMDPHPNAVSVTPASGSGAAATFVATYSAGLGYQDISWVQLLIAAAPDGGGQPYCFLHYDVQGDRFWVYGDGGFFQGPVQPGTASAKLQNTLCGLNTKTSTVTKSGSTLTFNAHVAFKSAAGLKIYLRAQTIEQLDTGWVQRGTWTTAPTPLSTMIVQPASGSSAQQTFTLLYPDPVGYEDTTSGWSQFLIAAATDGGGQPFCFVHYDKAGNGLWMYSSDVGFFLGPVAPGTASNVLDSSACSVNTALAGVLHPSGTDIVYVPVTLKAPMAGAKNLYQRTLDALSRDSGWVKTGTWTIP
ncbi:InlB B-repeat-containing protein [Paludibaculum fermentans]|uniref:InlB B-repeat-containing protein n=1 Tax=Paludibaculum fermentans TaxID=1473598 RepID=UPI003EB9843D